MSTRIDWLPYGIKQRAATFRYIASKIDQYGPVVGLSAADIDRIKAIAEEYQFAIDVYDQNRTAVKALRSWRDSVISNKRSNQLAGQVPQFNTSPAPVGTRRGLVAEMRKYVRLIKASGEFTTAIGAAMTIMSPNHAKMPLADLKPLPKVQSIEGFRLRITCEWQKMNVLIVEYRRNGEEAWQRIAFLDTLPATIYVEPAVRGVPESGYIRCFYFHRNKIVGKHSNMQPVTLFGS